MSGDSIVDRLQVITARIAGPARSPANAGPETPVGEGGFWLDSVDVLELIIACEEEFGVVFDPDTDLAPEALKTVGTLAEVVRAKVAN